MDGQGIVVLPPSQYIVMSMGSEMPDDIVEILGRIYKVTARGNIDITLQYRVAADWHEETMAIEKGDVL